MRRVFVSHSSKDDTFVNTLVDSLQAEGIETFVDHRDLAYGTTRWNERVSEELDACTQMIAVISPRSIKSKNCQNEWYYFIHQRKKEIVVAQLGSKVYFELITAQRADFRSEANYDSAFGRLLGFLTDNQEVLVSLPRKRPPKAAPKQSAFKKERAVPSYFPYLERQARENENSARNSLSPALADLYPLARRVGKFVGIATGDIAQIGNADVLVNSENDHLFMDQTSKHTVSASLHAFSADWDEAGRLVKDVVQVELDRLADNMTLPLPPGTVVVTSAGNLETNNVRHILHAVAVTTQPDHRFKAVSRVQLGRCVTNVLSRVDELNRRRHSQNPLKRIVMPIFGSGEGGTHTHEVAPVFIERAIDYLEMQPNSLIESVYFVAFRQHDLETLRTLFDQFVPDDLCKAVPAV